VLLGGGNNREKACLLCDLYDDTLEKRISKQRFAAVMNEIVFLCIDALPVLCNPNEKSNAQARI
jgi:hypothetical protein